MLDWFNSRKAAQIGAALAEEFATPVWSGSTQRSSERHRFGRTTNDARDSEVRSLHPNLYKKANFANSFKWPFENGVAPEIADEVTQSLVVHLSQQLSRSRRRLKVLTGRRRGDRRPSRENSCSSKVTKPSLRVLITKPLQYIRIIGAWTRSTPMPCTTSALR